MKLKDVYRIFIEEGKRADPRTKNQLQGYLRGKKNQYRKLSKKWQKFFDKEDLNNPYSDTRILYGNPQTEVKRVMVGIDIGVGELLLARELSRSGKKIDLIIAHHPDGAALAALDEVMHLQTDMLNNLGVEAQAAFELMSDRISEVRRGLHSINHARNIDAARLIGIPMVCCHTPADNHVVKYLQKLVNRKKPKTLKNIIELLLQEPEYKDAMKLKAGPKVLIGQLQDQAQKVVVDMTGGTEGSREIFARLSQLGIKTILGMHFSEAHYKKMKCEFLNVVNAGHIASDNLGMNLLLDKVERKQRIEFINCSGFRRFRR